MAELMKNKLLPPEPPIVEETSSVFREGWRSFKKNKLALAGGTIVLFFILLAIFAPVIAPDGVN
jgi:peptide/nickel transport system permease protein